MSTGKKYLYIIVILTARGEQSRIRPGFLIIDKPLSVTLVGLFPVEQLLYDEDDSDGSGRSPTLEVGIVNNILD